MKRFFYCITALAITSQTLPVRGQTTNPQPSWKDSYAVGGKCYCDSNGYDHGLDTKTVDTPQGRKNVVEVCTSITRVLGTGATAGRIPYNDIQCGNGPANDAPDEAACPGRVDIGTAGCNEKGPKWDLASVYGGGTPAPAPAPAPAPTPTPTPTPTATGSWSQVAVEWDSPSFTVTGMKRVRYGINTAWIEKTLTGPATCSNAFFGSDPAAGTRKICEVLSTPVTAPSADYVLPRTGWKATASSAAAYTSLALDDTMSTRWTTGAPQQPGQYFQIDMGKINRFDSIALNAGEHPNDYPRSYSVMVSNDGLTWRGPIAQGQGNRTITDIVFQPQSARFVRINQNGSNNSNWWTIADMNLRLNGPVSAGVLDPTGWALFASSDPIHTRAAVDRNSSTRWTTQTVQQPGQFFQIDMLKSQRFNKIVLASGGSPYDFPRGYSVFVSSDGVKWGSPVASGAANSATTTISFATRDARYIRIEQTSSHPSNWWSIHELSVFKAQ